MVKELNMQGVMLINEGVFSSGKFAVAKFKKEFNIKLIGMATGGATQSYGFRKPLEFDGKKFSVAIRFWDFSDIFGYAGAIQPDIRVPITIDDVENKRDVQLKAAYDFLLMQKKTTHLSWCVIYFV